MTAAVEAIYEDGLLRPLQPLALPEHARVRISVETMDERIVCLSRMALRQAPLVIGAVAVSVADDPHLVPGFGQ